MGIRENLQQVREKVRLAAARAGRDLQQIKIIAVTKRVEVSRMREVVQQSIVDLGENRVQELIDKINALPADINWHMIGHLQTNKVKYIVGRVNLIHSLDSWSLAEEIHRRAVNLEVTTRVLVQVNTSGEKTKYGISPEELADFLAALRDLPQISVQGLMTIAPYAQNPEEVRPYFRELRLLATAHNLEHLSMGMTNDFEVAVEEGADMLRLGTAIFGSRAN
ncbi:YggS family pyridoxal phosphate-dependent enzyme [Desulfoscipio gibsoniae]|uniref:Pyridoxal phosphate homeostasis protein n=1 Tax=Desulfoscipio gibsoniae DSM 7213 TaxID=767817 RepID=R4KJY3_9FIRM|nr:YggS family pyridoxal phosphate-dependent enzyme [Desulfoscipio gibsoniae]AGL02944.1 pyridoxal phosphate enzyme, YggS family [Desulfoscipio gibsoniae DSM 7213]